MLPGQLRARSLLQAVRIGPQRTTHEAKRRSSQGAGIGGWVATGAQLPEIPAAELLMLL
jgi:hypothetical protein